MASPDSIVIRAFSGGELAPSFYARADLLQYQIGLRTCHNFLVHRDGGASNRKGSRFIGPCADDDPDKRLVRYVHETPGESVLIEFGELYFRFWQGGALVELAGVAAWSNATDYVIGDIVEEGGVNYYCIADHTNQQPPNATFWYAMPDAILEIPHPFQDPRETHVVQSGRVLTFTHQDETPHDLIYVSLTRWAIVALDTTPQVGAPQNVMVNFGAAGSQRFGYVVTAAHPVTYEESLPSAQQVSAVATAPSPTAPHALIWDVVQVDGVNAPEYYVYCDDRGNGTYGFIGVATGAAAFFNTDIEPDYTQTPPITADPFAGVDDRPATCGYHQQRRFFANTRNLPDGVWGSQVGYPDNFTTRSPLQDDDALAFRIAGNNHHPVRRLVDLKNLLVLTDGGEWRLGTPDKVPLTPSSLPLDQETYVGISDVVPPVVVGNALLYVQARKSLVRDLRFEQTVEGLNGRDLTVFARHLFKKKQLRAMDFQQIPDSIVWVVRTDGVLLGLTYVPEQDVWGWHRHDTQGGLIEDVCVVPEDDEDAVYLLVNRGGSRMIEKLEGREIDVDNWNAEVFFVDSGLSYSGAPVSSVSGLDHLAGESVDVVGDGAYLGRKIVSAGGVVQLGGTFSDVHVGLPIDAEFETLNVDAPGSSLRQNMKRPQGVTLVLEDSNRGFLVGPSEAQTTRVRPGSYDPAAAAFTGDMEVDFFSKWEKPARVYVKQDQALPLTVLGVLPLVEIGG